VDLDLKVCDVRINVDIAVRCKTGHSGAGKLLMVWCCESLVRTMTCDNTIIVYMLPSDQ